MNALLVGVLGTRNRRRARVPLGGAHRRDFSWIEQRKIAGIGLAPHRGVSRVGTSEPGYPPTVNLVAFSLACVSTPVATQDFSDAATSALAHFDDEDPATLIAAVKALEEQVNEAVDASAEDFLVRGLTQAPLDEAAIEGLTHPDRDPTLGVPVSLAWLSPFRPEDHDDITLLDDLTPVEPASPEKYDRVFDEGGDCYPECEFARTTNQVTRQNILFTMDQETKKDFRALEVDGRAFRLSRGWFEEPASNPEGTATVQQSYTIEVWLADSGGSLRVQVTWVETTFTDAKYDDDLIAGTVRMGIDAQFDAHDAWISQQ